MATTVITDREDPSVDSVIEGWDVARDDLLTVIPGSPKHLLHVTIAQLDVHQTPLITEVSVADTVRGDGSASTVDIHWNDSGGGIEMVDDILNDDDEKMDPFKQVEELKSQLVRSESAHGDLECMSVVLANRIDVISEQLETLENENKSLRYALGLLPPDNCAQVIFHQKLSQLSANSSDAIPSSPSLEPANTVLMLLLEKKKYLEATLATNVVQLVSSAKDHANIVDEWLKWSDTAQEYITHARALREAELSISAIVINQLKHSITKVEETARLDISKLKDERLALENSIKKLCEYIYNTLHNRVENVTSCVKCDATTVQNASLRELVSSLQDNILRLHRQSFSMESHHKSEIKKLESSIQLECQTRINLEMKLLNIEHLHILKLSSNQNTRFNLITIYAIIVSILFIVIMSSRLLTSFDTLFVHLGISPFRLTQIIS